MPIYGDLLGLQRRNLPLGEIRIGTSVPIPGKNGRQPKRLETFRFTSASEVNAAAVAAHFGGKVAPWPQRKGRWEVITDRAALDVWVPPSDLAVDANMEMWDGPRRLRHCDGRIEKLSGQPCLCPRSADATDEDAVERAYAERKRLSKLRPPQACKPLTRINVTIPELPGLVGVWRLNTGSESTAVEAPASGEAMEIAREGGVYLPAVLRIEWRFRAADGSPYPVPVLQVGLSMQELAAGSLPGGSRGLLTQLQGAHPDARRAIGSAMAALPSAAAPGTGAPDLTMLDDRDPMTAQQIAALARQAKSPDDLKWLMSKAEEDGVDADMVNVNPDGEGNFAVLREYLRAVWRYGADRAGAEVA